MNYKEIDLENWDRKDQIEFYKEYDMPYIIMTAEVDVTNALRFAHENKVSFNLVMVYLANQAVNSIINFRYRLINGKPVLLEYNTPQVNHIPPGKEQYFVAFCPWPADNILDFCIRSHRHLEELSETGKREDNAGRSDFINYTNIPWVHFSHMFRTINKAGGDTNPKISFGKYCKKDGRVLMPVSMQSHHALTDGYHVGKFYQRLDEELAALS